MQQNCLFFNWDDFDGIKEVCFTKIISIFNIPCIILRKLIPVANLFSSVIANLCLSLIHFILRKFKQISHVK